MPILRGALACPLVPAGAIIFYLGGKVKLQIGDRRRGRDIGKKHEKNYFVWSACCSCGRKRWVDEGNLRRGHSRRCFKCSRGKPSNAKEKHFNWNGGRKLAGKGYISVLVTPEHPYFSMCVRSCSSKNGYILEHRLVMAKHLGRPLLDEEIVHHKDGNKLNNHIQNLELTFLGEHSKNHTKGYRDGYAKGYAEGIERARRELA